MMRAPASAALEVTGTIGATIYLDGVARGKVPSSIAGVPGEQGWIWLERNGARSLAHPVTFGTPLTPIEIEGLSDTPPPPLHLAATSAAVVPAAATSPPPPEASVAAHQSGTSPIVWIAVVAVGVAAGVALFALASSSSQPGMAVGIQSSPGSP
jgi:hypothetical protein